MYWKKIISFILIVFILPLTGCQNKMRGVRDIKDRGKITVVTNAVFPPFEYYKLDKVEGIDIDISKEIAKDLGVELEILEMNFDGVIAAITSGKGDFVASGLTLDKKKEKAISFSYNYITVPQSIIGLNDNNLGHDINVLKGKRIGTQIGTTSNKYVREEIESGFLKDSSSRMIEKKEYLDLVIDLRNNRLDVIALDGLIARELVKRNKDLRYFDRETEKYALAVKNGNYELLEEINKTLKRLLDSNKIEEYYHKHYDD